MLIINFFIVNFTLSPRQKKALHSQSVIFQIQNFIMGKPSFKSRKTSQTRKKKRFMKKMKSKEEEIADLQIQMQDFKRNVEDASQNLFNEVNRSSRENDNLVKWLKIYDEQLNNCQKEIYNLNLKLHFSSSSSSSQQPSQSQLQPPAYKSLADYFSSQE